MQLDELTQQNAALVEQASAASQSMAEQARGLNESMARYKVGDGQLANVLLHQPAVVPASTPAVPAPARRKTPVASKAAAARPVAAPAARAAAAGGDDAVWKEF
jgi:methyl-accepting chemotaxis protein